MSVLKHLKNYWKLHSQRYVSMAASPTAAFFIDAVRRCVPHAFCFFDLFIAYLGGERSSLILLHGGPPKYLAFPGNLMWRKADMNDPYTFLFLKRGAIREYSTPLTTKPILDLAAAILKLVGSTTRYSYCLAMSWMCVNDHLKLLRPMPKFLCVKGILFFSLWKSIFISIHHISLGLTDTLICFELSYFAIAHMYAFATRDYVEAHVCPGVCMHFVTPLPCEGHIHQGAGRDRRIRAALRYSQGGERKYWFPQPARTTRPPGRSERRVNHGGEEVYVPLPRPSCQVVHAADLQLPDEGFSLSGNDTLAGGHEVPFGDLDDTDDPCVDISSETARKMITWFSPIGVQRWHHDSYGAIGHSQPPPQQSGSFFPHGKGPSGLKSTRNSPMPSPIACFSPKLAARGLISRTSSASPQPEEPSSALPATGVVLPADAVDLVVEDPRAAKEEITRERRRGEPAAHGTLPQYTEEGEVEFARSPEEQPVQQVLGIGDDADDILEAEKEAVEVACAETPPVLAVVPDENPWA
ncbi:hypothetical protein L227DRAFT_621681 [Lentinus tigrinus ALCF2SS1-6]|uniref:Uncharacterized protein n=1 Tax=Lentinus tigrinus ALCF2SS1-6 TaxID=1328759 RepID=A0A5C2RMX2_9APHY|nr:hypothetical protein L227DRAFT_621681 [Lentinus tigrinus ALCF2SS1-6]